MATSVYSIGYMRGHHEENQTRFFAFFALAIAAALGAAFAGNMLTLFFCYEALTLSTYPLVTHHRSGEAKAGAASIWGYCLRPRSVSCSQAWSPLTTSPGLLISFPVAFSLARLRHGPSASCFFFTPLARQGRADALPPLASCRYGGSGSS